MAKVKVCGITNPEDAKLALVNGADYLGLVFAKSPRQVIKGQAKMIVDALPDFKDWVGVFMNGKKKDIEGVLEGLPIKILQFHGSETPAFCNYFRNRGFKVIKAIPVEGERLLLDPEKYDKADFFLFDTFKSGKSGGTGVPFNWSLFENTELQKYKEKLFLSGGLSPENVRESIDKVDPYCLDVSSKIEASPGKKDEAKLIQFFRNAKSDS